ncbi:MAG: hypothetical protein ACI8RZ_000617 [Myxococcota bacterium]|jgi:hypothetical protein
MNHDDTVLGLGMRYLLPFITTLVACAPPEAPEDLQLLAAYVFTHADDEDDEELIAGLDNLYVWMGEDQEEDIEEGYQINLLGEEAVSDLEGTDFDLTEDLVGAAVAHESTHSAEDFAQVMIAEDWSTVIVDQYEYYDKVYTEGEDCMVGRDCMIAKANSESELVQLGISIVSKNRIQYRWVETSEGWAFVHRSWLTEPPVVSSDLVEPKSQFFLSVVLPRDPIVRIQATWIDTTIIGISIPKNQVVRTMRDQGDSVEVFMDENY